MKMDRYEGKNVLMMHNTMRYVKLLVIVSVMALVAAACGGDEPEEETVAPPTTQVPVTTVAPTVEPTEEPAMDGQLVIGTLLPVTGDLAFLGPPEVAGARLAVADINAAGGVFGNDVVLHEGDSGDTNQDIANPEVDRLLALDVDAIIGAASSAVSKLVIDKITGNNVIQVSPANTSPDFTTYDDNGLYFRTAPSDLLQGKVLADLVASEGNEIAGVIFRQESYGQGLADSFKENFESQGGTVDPFIAYAPGTDNFDAEVDQLAGASPDAVVVIGFQESATILVTMHERGIGPTSATNVYGVDGNIGGIGAELSDPSIITGMRGTEPSVDLSSISDFTSRLEGAYEGGLQEIYAYGAETYDAIVIVALAALVANSDDPVTIGAQINGVTRGGTKCTSFAECKNIIESGSDPDYDGVGGPYEFVEAGEPAAASFRIATYSGGDKPDSALDEYVFAGGSDATMDDMEEMATGQLVIGTLLPVTGDLAFLGPPEVAGARLAVADINAAGGVFGNDVVLHEGDSGDTNQDIANPEVDRLLALDVDAIIGAASSAVSKLVIDKITGNNVIQVSPANTSPDFTTYDDNGLYFRTAPSDLLQGKVLADLVASEGNEIAGVIFRQESYGQGLADSFKENFESQGGTVDPFIAYAPGTDNFDAEVDQLAGASPDAVVVIGFQESATILVTMHERGIGPTSATNVYGVDGNIGGIGAELSDPSIITGMRGTEPSVDLSSISDFTSRLEGAYEGGLQEIYAYGAETYDAIVIVALAALVANSDDPVTIGAQINGVTRGGTKCTSFAECKNIIESGSDPDYDGVGGPYEFVEAGEPAAASFRIATYSGGDKPDSALDEYVFAAG